jgi:hypothetical protein
MTQFFKPPVLDPIQTRGLKDASGDKVADSWKGWFSNLYATIQSLVTMSTNGQGYTVATLPTVGTVGRRAYVTDALAPVFLANAVGGGAIITPVFDNGTHWIVG